MLRSHADNIAPLKRRWIGAVDPLRKGMNLQPAARNGHTSGAALERTPRGFRAGCGGRGRGLAARARAADRPAARLLRRAHRARRSSRRPRRRSRAEDAALLQGRRQRRLRARNRAHLRRPPLGVRADAGSAGDARAPALALDARPRRARRAARRRCPDSSAVRSSSRGSSPGDRLYQRALRERSDPPAFAVGAAVLVRDRRRPAAGAGSVPARVARMSDDSRKRRRASAGRPALQAGRGSRMACAMRLRALGRTPARVRAADAPAPPDRHLAADVARRCGRSGSRATGRPGCAAAAHLPRRRRW